MKIIHMAMNGGNMLLKDARRIAEAVHDNVESGFEIVKHCMVHVNPI